MKRTLIALALAAAPLALAGCAEDYGNGYDYGAGYGWQAYPYDVWYDGYYGPFYDGYWGTDGFFYFRQFQFDRVWRRGDGRHFHHNDGDHDGRDHGGGDHGGGHGGNAHHGGNHGGNGGNNNNGGHDWHHQTGTVQQPPPNAKLPNFPGWGTGPNGTRKGGK